MLEQKGRKVEVHPRADKNVDIRVALLHRVDAVLLSDHAAADADDERRVFLLELLETAGDREGAELRVLADGAGVDDDERRL